MAKIKFCNEENVRYDFRKAIIEKDEKKIKTKAEKKENQLFSNLRKQLRERNLKLVNVRGDRNCFFRAIAHQLYDDESQHQKVREEGVQEVIKNSNLYGNFVAGSFDKYVSNLSTDREWADSAAIQATSNVFRISIEILNASERIPSYTILPFDQDSVVEPGTLLSDTLVMCIMYPQNFMSHVHQQCGEGVLLPPLENL